MTKQTGKDLENLLQQIALDHLFIDTLRPATAIAWTSTRSASGASKAP